MLYGQDWNKSNQSLSSEAPNGSAHDYHVDLDSTAKITVIDLRSSEDFEDWHVRGATSIPLATLTAATPSPFDDVDTLQNQWKELKAKCDDQELGHGLDVVSGPVLMLCYNGETSRLSTAVMRAQGVQAYSVRNGIATIRGI